MLGFPKNIYLGSRTLKKAFLSATDPTREFDLVSKNLNKKFIFIYYKLQVSDV